MRREEDGQTDRQTDRQTGRQTGRERERDRLGVTPDSPLQCLSSELGDLKATAVQTVSLQQQLRSNL